MTELLPSKKRIEESLRVASILSNSDPSIGNVLLKSVNLLFTALSDGVASPTLAYASKGLIRETEDALNFDEHKSEPIRFLVYEVGDLLGKLIQKLNEKKKLEAEQPQMMAVVRTEPREDSVRIVEPGQPRNSLPDGEIKVEPGYYDHLFDAAENESGHRDETPVLPLFASDHAKQVPLFCNEVDDMPTGDSEANDLEDSMEYSNQYMDEASTSAQLPRKRCRIPNRRYDAESDDERMKKKKKEDNEGSDFEEELREEEEAKRNECYICGKTFKTQSHLKDHEDTHTGERRFPCPTCPAAFINTSKLKRHVRNVHGIDQFECERCGVVFQRKKDLREHVEEDTCEEKSDDSPRKTPVTHSYKKKKSLTK